jgi:hypothetical protein
MISVYGKFFIRLTILVVIFFIIDFAAGKVLNHFYFTQSSGFLYRMTYSIDYSNQQVLTFGSSRANHHYVPSVFENSFKKTFYNSGIDGQGILFEDALVKCILERYTPEYIILDFNAEEFAYSEASYDRLADLLPYYSEHIAELKPTIDLRGKYEQVKLLSKMYPFNSLVLSIAIGNTELNKKRKEDDKGYVPLQGTITYWPSDNEKISEKIDTNKVNAFKNLISQAKKKNVKIFVVVSPYFDKPLSTSYIDLAAKISDEMKISFWDYSVNEVFLKNDKLFKDLKHLNHQGAEIFSEMIAKRITDGKAGIK